LSLYNSGASNPRKTEEEASQDGATPSNRPNPEEKPRRSPGNPYLNNHLKDKTPQPDQGRNQSNVETQPVTSAFQHKKSAPVNRGQENESHRKPRDTNHSVNKYGEEDQDTVDINNLRGSYHGSKDPYFGG